MARIPDIERRLLNWARWKAGAGAGGLGYGQARLEASGAGGYREAVIPTVDCEASETDALVAALDPRLRDTVRQVYLSSRGNRASDARELGCAEATVTARVDEAHRCLSAMLSSRQEAARRERERVETLQRG